MKYTEKKLCKNCDTEKELDEFNQDIHEDYLDICKECEEDLKVSAEDRGDIDDFIDYLDKN